MHKSKWILVLIISLLLIIYIATIIYHQIKPLPEGVSYQGDIHAMNDSDVEFIFDLTYQAGEATIYERGIMSEVMTLIEEAESFIIFDMFMFNETSNEEGDYPSLSQDVSKALLAKHEADPDLKMVIITDPVNTTYFSHPAEHIEPLEEAGIEVVYTDLTELRDPTPLVTGAWRVFAQWFGQEGRGWLPNPFGPSSPDVTLRSYLKMANIKANHRKTLITDQAGLYMSWNAHDASGYHSNIAVKAKGEILRDMIESEKAVARFSGGDLSAFPDDDMINQAIEKHNEENDGGSTEEITAQVVTEKEIEHAFLDALEKTEEGDEVWLGMFYLADRHIINGLTKASDRGVTINLVLDTNQNAFGQEKVGLPNIPVSEELMDQENITVRWYDTQDEQYHAKISYIRYPETSIVIAGSSNFTSRNLDDYNLENNLRIDAANETDFIRDVDSYFLRIWQNEDGIFTAEYEEYQDALSKPMYLFYLVQQLVRITTY